MVPTTIRDLSYSVLKVKADTNYKALSSAVIYGANASGKSNSLLALEFLKALVISGNIKTQQCIPLPLIPYFCDDCSTPILIGIKFIYKNKLIVYEINISGTLFGDENNKSYISYEKLSINNNPVYERKNNDLQLFSDIDSIKDDESRIIICDKAQKSLLSNELFLANGFKTLIDTDSYSLILEWFNKGLTVIRNVNYVATVSNYDYDYNDNATIDSIKISDEIINKIARAAGINSAEIHYLKSDKDKKPQPISFIGDKGIIAKYIESAGTLKIINFLPIVISTMINGGTLVVDELDSSFSPTAVFSIINAFHNNELNIHKAQLIFTTHNPVYQKAKVFRRDEIKFVEMEDRASKIYSLSDFGTSGKDGVKNTSDIMTNYLTGKYGAINYVDFSDVIKEAMELNETRG
jgi:hypothetical protein